VVIGVTSEPTHRTIEVLARGDVKDATTHGEIDGGAVDAVEGQERGRGEGAEDDGGGALGEGDGFGRAELEIDQDDEERDEDEVDWRGNGHAVGVNYG
jgi:hypothetical protein